MGLPKLQEIIERLLEKKFSALPETQRPAALAKLLDTNETHARRLIRSGRNIEVQFETFVKLLPHILRAKIVTEHELLGLPAHDEKQRDDSNPEKNSVQNGGRKRHV